MTDDQGLATDDGAAFETLARSRRDSGPGEAIDELLRILDNRNEFRALLDAMLLKARHDLGLPLIQVGSLNDFPEPARSQYEERYVDAIRTVGGKLLERGEIAAAWPYFNAIGEREPIARAIDDFQPAEADERLGQIVEVAFNQGANPRKGFELILTHYGACSAITAFDHLPADEETRVACADRLTRQLHEHLVASLRRDVSQRGQPLPPEGTPVSELIAGRPWLFADDNYHLDVSHLGSVVRLSPMLADPDTQSLALELTDYGRNLSERHRYEGDPPFERIYEDHAVYLRALLGRHVEEAIAHFRGKLNPPDSDDQVDSFPAQVLVRLLVRLGRLDEAVTVAGEHLAGLPESVLICPSLAQLCQRAERLDRLADYSRSRGDLVNYVAAILKD